MAKVRKTHKKREEIEEEDALRDDGAENSSKGVSG